jgi:hypothetical protein
MATTKFQQRHYEFFAELIQEWRSEGIEDVNEFQFRLSREFARDNARFDKERFARACQPGANVKARAR